jgi:hypothetical protein
MAFSKEECTVLHFRFLRDFMLNTTPTVINGMNGQIPADMQAYENDYLFDLLGYRI